MPSRHGFEAPRATAIASLHWFAGLINTESPPCWAIFVCPPLRAICFRMKLSPFGEFQIRRNTYLGLYLRIVTLLPCSPARSGAQAAKHSAADAPTGPRSSLIPPWSQRRASVQTGNYANETGYSRESALGFGVFSRMASSAARPHLADIYECSSRGVVRLHSVCHCRHRRHATERGAPRPPAHSANGRPSGGTPSLPRFGGVLNMQARIGAAEAGRGGAAHT